MAIEQWTAILEWILEDKAFGNALLTKWSEKLVSARGRTGDSFHTGEWQISDICFYLDGFHSKHVPCMKNISQCLGHFGNTVITKPHERTTYGTYFAHKTAKEASTFAKLGSASTKVMSQNGCKSLTPTPDRNDQYPSSRNAHQDPLVWLYICQESWRFLPSTEPKDLFLFGSE